MESAASRADLFDFVSAIKNVVEAASDDDVFVEGGVRDELWIRLDGEGEFHEGLPMRHDLVERNPALEGGMPLAPDAFAVERRRDRAWKSEPVNPLRRDFHPPNRRNFLDLIPNHAGAAPISTELRITFV